MKPLNLSVNSITGYLFIGVGMLLCMEDIIAIFVGVREEIIIFPVMITAIIFVIIGFSTLFFKVKIGSEEK